MIQNSQFGAKWEKKNHMNAPFLKSSSQIQIWNLSRILRKPSHSIRFQVNLCKLFSPIKKKFRIFPNSLSYCCCLSCFYCPNYLSTVCAVMWLHKMLRKVHGTRLISKKRHQSVVTTPLSSGQKWGHIPRSGSFFGFRGQWKPKERSQYSVLASLQYCKEPLLIHTTTSNVTTEHILTKLRDG